MLAVLQLAFAVLLHHPAAVCSVNVDARYVTLDGRPAAELRCVVAVADFAEQAR